MAVQGIVGQEYGNPESSRIKQLEAERDALAVRFTAPIVCMCGSTRFKQSWISENARLTSEGNIVLAVGLWGHHERRSPTAEEKQRLDDLHKRKVDLCDWVWVLDVGGYIGDSTRSEIEYAQKLGKPIRYLSVEFPGYKEPVDELSAERDALAAVLGPGKVARKDCPKCHGSGLIQGRPTIYCTDSAEEIRLAYDMAQRGCDCRLDPAAILTAHTRRVQREILDRVLTLWQLKGTDHAMDPASAMEMILREEMERLEKAS